VLRSHLLCGITCVTWTFDTWCYLYYLYVWQEKSKEKDKKPVHGRKVEETTKKKQILSDLQVRNEGDVNKYAKVNIY